MNLYEIYTLNSDFDIIYMKDKILSFIKNIENNEYKKYLIIVVKFDIDNDEISFKYLIDIYKYFILYKDKIYFIFILNKEIKIDFNRMDEKEIIKE